MKVVSKFSVRLQKKKKNASFKNILCKGDSINYSKLSLPDLRRYTSHPSGYRD